MHSAKPSALREHAQLVFGTADRAWATDPPRRLQRLDAAVRLGRALLDEGHTADALRVAHHALQLQVEHEHFCNAEVAPSVARVAPAVSTQAALLLVDALIALYCYADAMETARAALQLEPSSARLRESLATLDVLMRGLMATISVAPREIRQTSEWWYIALHPLHLMHGSARVWGVIVASLTDKGSLVHYMLPPAAWQPPQLRRSALRVTVPAAYGLGSRAAASSAPGSPAGVSSRREITLHELAVAAAGVRRASRSAAAVTATATASAHASPARTDSASTLSGYASAASHSGGGVAAAASKAGDGAGDDEAVADCLVPMVPPSQFVDMLCGIIQAGANAGPAARRPANIALTSAAYMRTVQSAVGALGIGVRSIDALPPVLRARLPSIVAASVREASQLAAALPMSTAEALGYSLPDGLRASEIASPPASGAAGESLRRSSGRDLSPASSASSTSSRRSSNASVGSGRKAVAVSAAAPAAASQPAPVPAAPQLRIIRPRTSPSPSSAAATATTAPPTGAAAAPAVSASGAASAGASRARAAEPRKRAQVPALLRSPSLLHAADASLAIVRSLFASAAAVRRSQSWVWFAAGKPLEVALPHLFPGEVRHVWVFGAGPHAAVSPPLWVAERDATQLPRTSIAVVPAGMGVPCDDAVTCTFVEESWMPHADLDAVATYGLPVASDCADLFLPLISAGSRPLSLAEQRVLPDAERLVWLDAALRAIETSVGAATARTPPRSAALQGVVEIPAAPPAFWSATAPASEPEEHVDAQYPAATDVSIESDAIRASVCTTYADRAKRAIEAYERVPRAAPFTLDASLVPDAALGAAELLAYYAFLLETGGTWQLLRLTPPPELEYLRPSDLMRSALVTHPRCADALLLLAEESDSYEAALQLSAHAVEAARAWHARMLAPGGAGGAGGSGSPAPQLGASYDAFVSGTQQFEAPSVLAGARRGPIVQGAEPCGADVWRVEIRADELSPAARRPPMRMPWRTSGPGGSPAARTLERVPSRRTVLQPLLATAESVLPWSPDAPATAATPPPLQAVSLGGAVPTRGASRSSSLAAPQATQAVAAPPASSVVLAVTGPGGSPLPPGAATTPGVAAHAFAADAAALSVSGATSPQVGTSRALHIVSPVPLAASASAAAAAVRGLSLAGTAGGGASARGAPTASVSLPLSAVSPVAMYASDGMATATAASAGLFSAPVARGANATAARAAVVRTTRALVRLLLMRQQFAKASELCEQTLALVGAEHWTCCLAELALASLASDRPAALLYLCERVACRSTAWMFNVALVLFRVHGAAHARTQEALALAVLYNRTVLPQLLTQDFHAAQLARDERSLWWLFGAASLESEAQSGRVRVVEHDYLHDTPLGRLLAVAADGAGDGDAGAFHAAQAAGALRYAHAYGWLWARVPGALRWLADIVMHPSAFAAGDGVAANGSVVVASGLCVLTDKRIERLGAALDRLRGAAGS